MSQSPHSAQQQPQPGRLAGREVLLCATGGIACYKTADLASKLVQDGAGVTVALTDAAQQFVTALTFQTLTARKVFTTMWQPSDDYSPQHISLTERAELMVIAPATADILAKLAAGIADDLVSTLAQSAFGACPLLVAPAMNTRMWLAPPTQANMTRIRQWGVHVIEPAEGRLACGTTGPGRMAEPADILARVRELLGPPAK